MVTQLLMIPSDKYHKTCCLLSLPNVVAMVDLGPLLMWVRIEFDH